MNAPSASRPNACLAQIVMALVLATALLTLAAVALFLVALLPIPAALRLWVGGAIFVLAGAVVVRTILRRARSGDTAMRQQLDAFFGPLGLKWQPGGEQAGTWAGEYRGRALRAAYAISGTPQRPGYHLEIALHSATSLRLAAGMAKFQLQFDETQFGQALSPDASGFTDLLFFTTDPDAARALLASVRAKQAILDLLSPQAPGVRNLIIDTDAVILRYRHLSLKGLNAELVKRWVDDLRIVSEMAE